MSVTVSSFYLIQVQCLFQYLQLFIPSWTFSLPDDAICVSKLLSRVRPPPVGGVLFATHKTEKRIMFNLSLSYFCSYWLELFWHRIFSWKILLKKKKKIFLPIFICTYFIRQNFSCRCIKLTLIVSWEEVLYNSFGIILPKE